MKDSTCLAPSRSVYPQSPSPTIVSYSVIVGSSLMTALQPASIRARIGASVNCILEVVGERAFLRILVSEVAAIG